MSAEQADQIVWLLRIIWLQISLFLGIYISRSQR